MNKLLSYYQRELNFLKQHGKIFASRFPKIARRLGIVEGESEDPHVSRLVESFALLTSRIHQRLDDDMPEVIEALLSTLAPQFLRPAPSACIVVIEPDQQRSGLSGKNIIPADTALFSRQGSPLPCQFSTTYPVELLPLSLCDAVLCFNSDELNWQLRLQFRVWPGAQLADDKIRIYLHGPHNAVNTLYALLCSEIKLLHLCQGERTVGLDADAVRPVGFGIEESLMSRDPRVSPVHTLLLDYYYFPQKFSFVDIHLPEGFTAAAGDEFELRAVFKRNALTERLEKLAEIIDVTFFRLNCTPALNLFTQRAEPITLTEATAEYQIVPDIRHQTMLSIWSVDQVFVQRKNENHITQLPVFPLLESRFTLSEDDSGLRWQTLRRDIATGDGDNTETKLFIAFSELRDCPPLPSSPDIVTMSLLCTNHSLPHQMQYGQSEGDFDCEAPVAGLKIVALTHPTQPVAPPDKNAARWRFLSQLSLNHQLFDGENGAQRLKDTLAIYCFDSKSASSTLIDLIKTLSCLPVTTRLISNDPHSLARGLELTVTFSHDALRMPGYYLFCSLLDRLLALYAPVNSFTCLITCIENEEQTRRRWPIRAGRLSWL
ncbi:type VI secretion system baseplate subunit TssF [Enterobacter mori]|uniref:type VI secretion system baseplate subunit TssF n=1 Tax=Enterobacter mori TaxID=539813 RepID=UPI003B83C993